MTKATKLTRFTMAGLMVCSMALTTMTTVAATSPNVTTAAKAKTDNKLPETVTVNVHKLSFLDADSTPQQNTGAQMTFEGSKPVPGVQFDLYNIRGLVDSMVPDLMEKDESLTLTEAIKKATTQISHEWSQNKGTWIGAGAVKGDSVITGNDGVAKFNNVVTKTGDKYQIYLAEEVRSETLGNSNMFMSLPLVFGMPITDDDGKYFEDIHLYAKNSAIEKQITNTKDENSSDEKVYNFEVGEEISYDARVNIPGNIKDKKANGEYLYNKLNIKDQMTEVGTTLKGIDKIEADGVDVTQLFTDLAQRTIISGDANSKAGFTYNIDFATANQDKLTELLNAIAGTQVKFTYTVVINEYAVPTQDIGNEFGVTLGDESIVAKAKEVETGGYKFTKVDSNDDDIKLAGATFKVARQRGDITEYAEFDGKATLKNVDGVYATDDIVWNETGTTFETGSSVGNEGNLQISGLETGDYKLHEIKAPDGYAKSDTPLDFSITKGADGKLELNTDNNLYAEVENTPIDGVLPITGSMGIVAFLIVGTAAMGTAVMIKKRRA